MEYVISYKGKILGEKMPLDLAEGMLVQLSSCFRNLEIMEAPEFPMAEGQTALQASDRKIDRKADHYYNLA